MQALAGLLRTMRPRQWTKNSLIFAGIFFDAQVFVPASLLRVSISFALLCLISSAVYIINDLVDIESDRQHPRKRYRPLPAGQLPIPLARIAAVVIPLFAVGAAWLYSQTFALILVVYLILQIFYSFYLKHIVIVDILAVTAGFILRVAAGAIVISVTAFSPWLYALTALLSLFLIIGKRRQELMQLDENAVNVRPIYREYNLPLLDDMLRLVMTSTLIAYVLYAIEAPSETVINVNPNLPLITVPFVLYGLFRYLYLMRVKGEGSAPDEVLLRDRPLQLAIFSWALTFAIILYLPRLMQ